MNKKKKTLFYYRYTKLGVWIQIGMHMDIIPDSHENLCGSEKLD